MPSYQRLTREERYQIEAYLRCGQTLAEIARQLKRPPSTISRELARNGCRSGYLAERADAQARQRQRERRRAYGRYRDHWRETLGPLLQASWSPQQISAFCKAAGQPVSHEWLYQQLAQDKRQGGDWYRHLRFGRPRRRRRVKADRRGQLKDRRLIGERPAVVEARTRLGDWEVDSMVGPGKARLLTLVERRSRFVHIVRVADGTAGEASKAIECVLSRYPASKRQTVTSDNGKEFAGHIALAKDLELAWYFARPYASWQRGTNENMNGLIREFFPKGTNFGEIGVDEIAWVEKLINCRPRKCLNWKTPREIMALTG